MNGFDIDGFNSYHSTRPGRDGGGLSIWISSKYTSECIFEHRDNWNNLLLIYIQQINIKILGIYNTNDNEFLTHFDSILENNQNCIVIGDMNINLLENNNKTMKYTDTIHSNGYHILNKINTSYATRNTNTTNTIIDHAITDIINKNYILSINSHCFSDHESITLQIGKYKYTSDKATVRKVKINEPQIVNEFNHTKQNIDTYSQLHAKLIHHIQQNTTTQTKTISHKTKLPYINNEIKKIMKERDKLYILHKRYYNNQILKNKFCELRNKATNLIRTARRQYEYNRVNEAGSDNRKLWLVLNSCLFNRITNKHNFTNEIHINNIHTSDIKSITEHFNNFFISVGNHNNRISINDINLSNRYRGANAFKFSHINNDETIIALNNLKENTTPGYDNISVKLLKSLVPDNINTFTKVINDILSSQTYPNELKTSKVLPIYKNGKKDLVENYRPISILPTFSKLIESIIYNQLMSYLQDINFFHPDQYGFTPKSGTEIATINLVQNICDSLDNKKHTSSLFIDLKKAFDTVNRPLFIKKICDINVCNSVINLIKSFLTTRQQYTFINNCTSTLKNSVNGVPQGSKLAALFFIIYINDIFNCNLNGTMQLYADDIVLSYSCDTIDALKDQMQNDLHALHNYFSLNLLTINAKKTNYIIFMKRRTIITDNFTIKYDNEKLNRVKEVTYLGLKINEKLDWTPQIDHIKTKIVSLVGALKRTQKYLPKNALTKIYFAHIYPYLNYASPIWANAPKYKISQLKRIQNKAIKAILKKPRITPTNTLYNFKFQPLENIIKMNQAIILHKIKNNLIKHNIQVVINSEVHGYNTRSGLQIHQNIVHTGWRRQSPIFKCIKSYNEIPQNIKAENNIKKFKLEVRKFMSNNIGNI